MVSNKQRRVSSQKISYQSVIKCGYENTDFLIGGGVCINLDVLQNVVSVADVTAMGDAREGAFLGPETGVA